MEHLLKLSSLKIVHQENTVRIFIDEHEINGVLEYTLSDNGISKQLDNENSKQPILTIRMRVGGTEITKIDFE